MMLGSPGHQTAWRFLLRARACFAASLFFALNPNRSQLPSNSRLPAGSLACRSSTYGKLAARLQQLAAALCEGRLVFLLEGGYHTEAVGESVCEVFLALLGRPSLEAGQAMQLPQPEPVAEVQALVARLKEIHRL
jgi:hypothetical protein